MSKRIVKLTESQLKNVVEKIVKENKETVNEMFGIPWLMKVKVDTSQPMSQEDKMKMVDYIGKGANGRVAIEFESGEWYDNFGNRIEDIDAHEKYVEDELFGDEPYRKVREKLKSDYEKRYYPDIQPNISKSL